MALIGGMSNTWRRSSFCPIIPCNGPPQHWQYPGFISTIVSGAPVISIVFPLCPGWPPGFFPVACRKLFVRFGGHSSLLGGILLLWLSFLCFKKCISSFNRLFSSFNNSTSCCSSSTRARISLYVDLFDKFFCF